MSLIFLWFFLLFPYRADPGSLGLHGFPGLGSVPGPRHVGLLPLLSSWCWSSAVHRTTESAAAATLPFILLPAESLLETLLRLSAETRAKSRQSLLRDATRKRKGREGGSSSEAREGRRGRRPGRTEGRRERGGEERGGRREAGRTICAPKPKKVLARLLSD